MGSDDDALDRSSKFPGPNEESCFHPGAFYFGEFLGSMGASSIKYIHELTAENERLRAENTRQAKEIGELHYSDRQLSNTIDETGTVTVPKAEVPCDMGKYRIQQLGQLFITSQVFYRHILFNLLSILMMHVEHG